MNKFLRTISQKFNLETIICFGYKSQYPQRQLVLGYLIYSLVGTLLLLLPLCRTGSVSLIDNLFTAVSALSTTGLSTVDVSSQYTFWGQLVILALVQLGGLGYMTFSSYIMFKLTHHLGTHEAKMFHTQFSFPDKMKSDNMLGYIVNFAIIFEVVGVMLLYPYFLFNDIENPLWSAIFHSVSAFCTAGFSTFSDNLMRFQSDWYVNLVIIFLSYMGAMGFIMMTDIMRKISRKGYHISFTSKVIAVITTALTLWSTLHLFFFEPSIQTLDFSSRLLTSLFHSMSAITTVGFNTIDTSSLVAITMMMLSFSMYVGASPSGTGGGLKSTTISAIFAYTKNKLGMRKNISLAGNKVPTYRVEAALSTIVFYTFILATGIYLITMFEGENNTFLDIVFEATSALATAGLSSGILSSVCIGSKLVLIVMMFIGRVGVITIGNVMLIKAHADEARRRSDLVI
ncbi:MAG: TrkH family potassium uptake protein [Muribaculaceae bacterium]